MAHSEKVEYCGCPSVVDGDAVGGALLGEQRQRHRAGECHREWYQRPSNHHELLGLIVSFPSSAM